MKNTKYKYKLIALVLSSTLGGLTSGFAGAAQPLVSLKDMVEKTVSSNPEVQLRYHRLLESGFEQEVAKGGFYPKADIVSTYRNQERLIPSTGSGTEIPHMNNELVLRQSIFQGFSTVNDVKRLGHTNRQRYYELQSAMQDTTLEFIRAYIDDLRYTELSQYAKDNYVVHKQLFDRIKDRVNAGVAKKVDLEQAAGRLALAEANLLTETTNLHDVTARIQRLYGELPPETLETPAFFNSGVEPTAADALRVAYNQNPDLLSAIEGIQANKDEIKAREGAYLPRLDLQARKNLGVSNDGRYSTNAADVLELTMNFNLFNGFADQNTVKQTAQRLNEAHDIRDKACVDTRQLLVIAYNDIDKLKEQVTYRTQHKNSIENAREAYRKQFDIGQRTLLDLLDSENEYFQAKRTLSNTQYDLQTAYARLYATQGELLRRIGAARGSLAEYKRENYMDNENVCQAIAPIQENVDKAALLAAAKPLAVSLPLAKPAPAPLAPLAVKPEVASCNVSDITNRVNDWATAWRQKDADAYWKSYGSNFVPEPPLNKATWTKQRQHFLATYDKISLVISDIKPVCSGNMASATFKQQYNSTSYAMKKVANTSCEVCNMKRYAVKGYSDNVIKELKFELVNGQWVIVREKATKY